MTRLRGAGVEIAADLSGPENGQPIVFLPGGGQTRASWGRATRLLADAGYRILSLDLRGHGESGWSPDGDYHLDRFVDDLATILADVSRPAFLVGASLGGLTCLVTAGERRADVAGLVLVDVAPRIELAGASRIAAFMRAAPEGFASVEEAADAVSAYQPHRSRPRDVTGLRKNLRLDTKGRYQWHWDPAFTNREISQVELVQDGQRLRAAAHALTVPTLLVRGALSEVVSQQSVDEFSAVTPQLEVVTVAAADHMVAGDANDAFNDAVISFVERSR